MGWLDVGLMAGEGIGVKMALSSGNPYLVGAAAAFLIGDFVYNYLTQDTPPPPKTADQVSLPITAEGTAFPMFYGRVKVDSPVLMFVGDALANTPSSGLRDSGYQSPYFYTIPMTFCLGITPVEASCKLLKVYIGGTVIPTAPDAVVAIFGYPHQPLNALVGNGGHENRAILAWVGMEAVMGDQASRGGWVEMMNGSSACHWIQADGASSNCYTADVMIWEGIAGYNIPDYRGKMCVSLMGNSVVDGWSLGPSASVEAVAFEVFAQPGIGSQLPIQPNDMNPVDVLYDILTGSIGKLDRSPALIDWPSFAAARQVIFDEQDGYSRFISQGQTANDVVNEILAQIDGILYEDPGTGIYYLKLIRPDYDIYSIPVIDPSNCKELVQFSSSLWADLPNQVRILFTDRSNEYAQGSAVAQSQGNAYSQDGELREIVVQMAGINTQDNADTHALRELMSRNKPLMKCVVNVLRTDQLYNMRPGDACIFSWPEASISNIIMRLVNRSRGTLQDGKMKMTLVQDTYFQWKHTHPVGWGDVVTGIVHGTIASSL